MKKASSEVEVGRCGTCHERHEGEGRTWIVRSLAPLLSACVAVVVMAAAITSSADEPEWCFVVVGDSPGAPESDTGISSYLSDIAQAIANESPKVDFVLSEDVPWNDGRLAGAATLHLGGTRTQMAQAEREVARGRHADWPMVLAAQSFTADPGRVGAQGRRPLWTYAHVPAGSSIDQTDRITAVMERFAPGFSDIVVAARGIPANRLHLHDANYVGGDIGVGGNSVLRALLGPTPRVNPWSTPVRQAYLCSSATPPGGGVHGMSGYYAARTVLKREFGLGVPSLRP